MSHGRAAAAQNLDGTFILSSQLQEMAVAKLGFDKAKKIVYPVTPELEKRVHEAGLKPVPWGRREIDVKFAFVPCADKGGVIVTPFYNTNYVTNLTDAEAVRILQVLAAHDPEADPLIKTIAEKGENLLLTWEELGYPGLRDRRSIFMDHFSPAWKLSQSTASPFHPLPETHIYLLPEYQADLIRMWRQQLAEFRMNLG